MLTPPLPGDTPGSPLNRVSFLRASHPFLRAALPSSRILLLRNLEPLADSDTTLAWVDYPSVAPLIGSPFDLAEDKLIEAYDSRTEIPTLLFLGLDEKAKEAFEYANGGTTYTGQPYFALDITPRPSYQAAAEAIAESAVQRPGVEFRRVRIDLSLVPPDGTFCSIPSLRSCSG